MIVVLDLADVTAALVRPDGGLPYLLLAADGTEVQLRIRGEVGAAAQHARQLADLAGGLAVELRRRLS